MMRPWLIVVVVTFIARATYGQGKYTAFENYLKITEPVYGTDTTVLGQVTGLAVDGGDNLHVYHRAGRVWDLETREPIGKSVILVFNELGNLVTRQGTGASVLPHMLDVDSKGNTWIVEVSRHQVILLSVKPRGNMILGEAFVPGNDPLHFNLPTDVCVLGDGSFYVSDGYRNSRIIKFSKDGKYQFEWGKKGTGDGEFNIPHSVKYFNGKVYVADRENSRLQVFDAKGNFLSKLDVGEKIGRLFAVTLDKKGNIYLSGMKEEGGGTLILSPDLKIKAELNTGGHDIAVDSKGAVYVTKGNNVTKFIQR